MSRFIKITGSYLDPKVAVVFFMGISSGLPFLLILSTLGIWLTEAGISKTQIGLFAWVTLPYALKFLWSPVFENVRLPVLTRVLGQRRGWLVVIQVVLMISLLMLGRSYPSNEIFTLMFWAFMVGFCSASQDILIEAYRINSLPSSHVGLGAGASALGYNVGIFIGGAIALYLSSIFSWRVVYSIMALFVGMGIIVTFCCHDPKRKSFLHQNINKKRKFSVNKWLRKAVYMPYIRIIGRNDWWVILTFIFSYKACDTILKTMNSPFLISIGFSKAQIAYVGNGFGITAMIFGGLIGGVLLTKYALRFLLLFTIGFQIITCSLFVLQSFVGADIFVLFFTMGVENFTCGISQVFLIAYLTSLCNVRYSGLHFAFLTSVSSLDRVCISALSGWLADRLVWSEFFVFVSLLSVPAFVIILRFVTHFEGKSAKVYTNLENQPKIIVS